MAGSFAFWGLRLFAPSTPTPSYAIGVGEATAPRGDLTRLLGPDAVASPMAQPQAASRFTLSGVLSPKEGFVGSHGVALIAVDGKPARAYQVGARLVDNWVLQSVTRRTASLGPSQAGAAIVLELPERPAPATGTLPPFNGGEMGSPPAPSAPVMQAPVIQAPQIQPQAQPQFQPPPQYAEPLPQQPQDGSAPADQNGGAGPQMGQGPPRRSAPESR